MRGEGGVKNTARQQLGGVGRVGVPRCLWEKTEVLCREGEGSVGCVAPLVPQMIKNPPAMQETQVQYLGGEDFLEKGLNGNPLQYSCLENSKDRGTQ